MMQLVNAMVDGVWAALTAIPVLSAAIKKANSPTLDPGSSRPPMQGWLSLLAKHGPQSEQEWLQDHTFLLLMRGSRVHQKFCLLTLWGR